MTNYFRITVNFNKDDHIMSAIDDLKTAVATLATNDAALKGSVDTAVAKIAELAAQIAAGSSDPVIADLASQITTVAGDLATEKNALDTAVTPPVVVPTPIEPVPVENPAPVV